MALVRVQVLLGEDENEALSREARRLRVSKSEVVRRHLRGIVGERPEEDPFLAMIGALKDVEETDMSVHHDTYIYGGEMRP